MEVFLIIAGCMAAGGLIWIAREFRHAAPHTPSEESPLHTTPGERRAVCHHCMALNTPMDHFCRKCGTPLTAHAELDPMGSVYARGDTFRKATARPTRPATVIGMWLIFGVQLPLLVFWFLRVARDGEAPWSATRFLASLVSLGLIGLYVAILAKVTRNYRRRGRTPPASGVQEDATAEGRAEDSPT